MISPKNIAPRRASREESEILSPTMRSFLRCSCLALTLVVAEHLAAAPAPFSDELLARAVAETGPSWKGTPGRRSGNLPGIFAMQLVAVATHLEPGRRVADTTLAAGFVEKLRSFLRNDGPDADGNTREPDASGGIGGWTHNSAAQCLLLARRTPAVWDALTPDDRHRADLLMHALAVAAHFNLDDANDYPVILDGISLYHKSWNPNITEGYADVAIAASLYFGAAKLDAFFQSFDFDAFIAELRAVKFHNIVRIWTHTPAIRELLMHGGAFTSPGGPPPVKLGGVTGTGAGVRRAFRYRGWSLAQPWEIYRIQADRQFSKTVRSVVTIDGENRTRLLQRASSAVMSPWEGRLGMCVEFESTDWDGFRSSLTYAYEGTMIHLSVAATLRVLGEWRHDETGRDIERRMAIGVSDLMFKAREGYRGWSLGKERINWLEQDLQPLGSDYVFPLWTQLFPPPEPLRPIR